MPRITINLNEKESKLKDMIGKLSEYNANGNPYFDRSESVIAKMIFLHGPRVISSRRTPDRTCVLTMDLKPAYLAEVPRKPEKGANPLAAPGCVGTARLPHWGGLFADFGVRGMRCLAVDASGRSGSPLLVAIVDRLTVQDPKAESPAEAPTSWSLPVAKKAGPLEIESSRFTIGPPDGPTLSGVLVTPAKMAAKSLSAEGAGNTFVVFTLQKGPAADLKVDGQGLTALVRAGPRTVRFQNGSLVLE